MSDPTPLERRYRRLLALYPKAFRREHEDEVLSVLMAGAAEGQRRPRLAEYADLIRNAVLMRLRRTRRLQLPGPWERRHARFMIPLRLATGTWLLVLTGILYGAGHGGWWGALLLPAAALHFFLVYRLVRGPKAS